MNLVQVPEFVVGLRCMMAIERRVGGQLLAIQNEIATRAFWDLVIYYPAVDSIQRIESPGSGSRCKGGLGSILLPGLLDQES